MHKLLLSKMFTREHSLFYCFVWSTSDLAGISKWADISPVSVIVGEGEKRKIAVYYSKSQLDEIFAAFEEKIISNPQTFFDAEKEFYVQWEKIVPYLKKEKTVETVEEVENFYNTFIKWWSPMALLMNVPEMKRLSEDVRIKAMKIREDTQHYSDDGDKLFIDFFTKYFPEYKELAYVITPEEVFTLKNKKFEPEAIELIKKRLEGYVVFKTQVYPFLDLHSILDSNHIEFENDVDTSVTEIKGNVASVGKIQGRVRLVLYKEQIGELEEGEVLVTEMTAPDFVPAMKKAAAIVTDEGGITSHAAIVSRELKKPCIIGAKIATQVLKDGDMVEVDANNGIVRIL